MSGGIQLVNFTSAGFTVGATLCIHFLVFLELTIPVAVVSGTEATHSLISVFLRAEHRVRLMTEFLTAVTLDHMEPVFYNVDLEIKIDTVILLSDSFSDLL